MRLDGRRSSSNVEDRRGLSGGKVAGIGGIGAVIIAALFAWITGGDPVSAGLQAFQQQMQAPSQAAAGAAAGGWTCECGTVNKGKFCTECGKPQPAPKPAAGEWTCSCGTVNKGKFCTECGKPAPVSGEWTCECGAVNKGKFCTECGKPRQ